MKRKLITVLLSAIPALLVAGIVLAATTIGTNISTDGTISSGGNATISGNLGVTGTSSLTGNVGIGTSAPLSKLDVRGDIYTNSGVGFYAAGDSTARNVFYRSGGDFAILRNYSQLYTLMQIWSPSGTLGAVEREATLALTRGDEPNQEFLDLYNNGYISETQFGIRIQKRGTGQYRDFVFDQYDGTNAKIPVMILKANTSVGIGTSAPLSKLDVNGGAAIGAYAGVSTAPTNGLIVSGNVGVATSSPNARLNVLGSTNDSTAAALNIANASSTSLLYARNDGNVGLGTATPLAKLHLYDTASGMGMRIQVADVTSYLTNNYANFQIAHGSATITMLSGGNVGVGVAGPTAALHLKAGTIAAGTAPLKFTSGINLTTPEAGAVEWDGTNLYLTDSGASRWQLAQTLSGTTASIGGGALLAGACSLGTVTVTGAAVGMSVVATPTTYPGDGTTWNSYVSAANTVTVKVCAIVAATPTASTYNVRVIR